MRNAILFLCSGVILGMSFHYILFLILDYNSKYLSICNEEHSDLFVEEDKITRSNENNECDNTVTVESRIIFDRYSTKCSKYAMTEQEKTNHKLCIIVPFRDSEDPTEHGKGRNEQLQIFKEKIKEEMQNRHVDYRLVVAEQEQGLPFNRAALLNAGFLSSFHICDYFAFHDVDIFPTSLNNTYGYPETPTHCYSSTNYWNQHQNLVGGVLLITLEQYIKANGFSNAFWGWGWEDNDMYQRIIESGQQVYRLPYDVGKYSKLQHEHASFPELLSRNQTIVSEKYLQYSQSYPKVYKEDGLSDLNCTVVRMISDTRDFIHLVYDIHNRKNLL